MREVEIGGAARGLRSTRPRVSLAGIQFGEIRIVLSGWWRRRRRRKSSARGPANTIEQMEAKTSGQSGEMSRHLLFLILMMLD